MDIDHRARFGWRALCERAAQAGRPLSERQQAILILRFVAGMTIREIARAMDVWTTVVYRDVRHILNVLNDLRRE